MSYDHPLDDLFAQLTEAVIQYDVSGKVTRKKFAKEWDKRVHAIKASRPDIFSVSEKEKSQWEILEAQEVKRVARMAEIVASFPRVKP